MIIEIALGVVLGAILLAGLPVILMAIGAVFFVPYALLMWTIVAIADAFVSLSETRLFRFLVAVLREIKKTRSYSFAVKMIKLCLKAVGYSLRYPGPTFLGLYSVSAIFGPPQMFEIGILLFVISALWFIGLKTYRFRQLREKGATESESRAA
jgi:hypothetical protein